MVGQARGDAVVEPDGMQEQHGLSFRGGRCKKQGLSIHSQELRGFAEVGMK